MRGEEVFALTSRARATWPQAHPHCRKREVEECPVRVQEIQVTFGPSVRFRDSRRSPPRPRLLLRRLCRLPPYSRVGRGWAEEDPAPDQLVLRGRVPLDSAIRTKALPLRNSWIM